MLTSSNVPNLDKQLDRIMEGTYPPGRPMKPPTRFAISIFRSHIESTTIYVPARVTSKTTTQTYRIDLDHSPNQMSQTQRIFEKASCYTPPFPPRQEQHTQDTRRRIRAVGKFDAFRVMRWGGVLRIRIGLDALPTKLNIIECGYLLL